MGSSLPAFAEEGPRAFIWPGASGLVLVDPTSGGGFAQLGLSYKLASWIEPEVDVGLGLTAGGHYDYLNRFSFGIRFNVPADVVKPFGWIAFSHVHEAPLDVFVAAPVETILGLSEAGVFHRSGAELGLGLTFPVQTLPFEGAPVVEISLRTTALYLPAFASFVDKAPARGSHLYGVFEVLIGLPLDLSALQGDL